MIASIDIPSPVDVQYATKPRPGEREHAYKLAFSPRFRGFQTSGSRRHPRRLADILRTLDARAGTVGKKSEVFPAVSERTAEKPTSPASGTGPIPAERRRFLRRQSTNLVRVLPFREIDAQMDEMEWALHESPLRGQMLDISMNGVAFLLKQPMVSSDRVWLKLESRARDFAVVRSARIVRVVPTSPGNWTVTCRFDHCVPYADVVQLSHFGSL